MRSSHPREATVGMEYYVSDADGVGGRLRADDADFRVRELERFDTEPVDAPTDAYPHLVFRATLRGWDTNDFAARVSDALGISRERVNWAGTKDKYAVTTQLFSVYGADPEELPEIDGVEIEVLGRAGRNLEFGDLAGNAFELRVTDPVRPDNADAITDELRAFGGLADEHRSDGADGSSDDATSIGVPNFFGQQRFGSRRPVTHKVGLAIARDDWEGAVMAYLGNPTDAEPAGTQEARAFVAETRDWQEALERVPHRLRYERSMIHALAEHDGEPGPDQYREALERVPSNLQRLFVHAAQSYAFNLMLSERLERGLPFDRPVEGDVVCFSDTDAPDGLALPDTDRLQRVDERRVDSVTRHCERGRAFVTAPLVGTETELADGEQGEIERAVLDDLGLEPADFDLPGEFGSTGTRRAILLRTDLGLATDPLTLEFALPKGSYATVVSREFLKVDPINLG
ncbi:tRNA pseudouridine synthase D [Natrinema pellirubrum DSM 15624]|uniref:Probable tRNA pseudouridine synthase D n=1 Tax=Natrinema pellirubrum (strain DSM 15624 / CIP 106293 / JCM 10476 / NCIMB 786 / 157) TaxID=797303 RepID=L0JQ53_NATP1|nr:tRNA pseudouridine(13) synthase TruD [Natrinema pellirubrum]AGB32747.1 tRNA pseudouridine synthase, TruD family [Natrinema pellirubrum DSM 15624]ELY75750.1 tRNA pseudouridine synthase D [Natrinema pellirubrum DSM 15624]